MLDRMHRHRGVSASGGIAIGPAYLADVRVVITERRILRSDRAAELARLDDASRMAEGQLERLHRQIDGPDVTAHELIDLHRLILRSPELADESRRMISDECFAAEWAVSRALERIRSVFARLDDPYFRDRSSDFEAAGERLLRALLGLPEAGPERGAARGAIAVAGDVGPLHLFQLRRAGVEGLVSEGGGATSHAAIIARAFDLPYVVGVHHACSQIRPGATLIVDGTRGEIIVEPDDETLKIYRARADARRERDKRLRATRTLPSVTADGVEVHLGANVESLAGVSAAIAVGAESIGLFRTEFLYLERADLPTEEEHYQDALAVLRAAGGLPVTFRTLDLGGDKLPAALRITPGANPALGVRSARFSLLRPDILKRQLRAFYRAAAVGPLRFMFPLVTHSAELGRLRAICDEVRAELRAEKITHDPAIALGVMIETPSAALTADHLARRCDFLSVGTNDLIQYAFAADRDNDEVAHLQSPLHPAVLRLLRSLAETARAESVPISICGDMAGDPLLTSILVGLGFRELSMERSRIPLVKQVVRGSTVAEMESLARAALTKEDEAEVRELIQTRFVGRFSAEVDDILTGLDAA
jgi:phosphoenolpyruvate-protein phosphotransferase (PTS system enzyme I)